MGGRGSRSYSSKKIKKSSDKSSVSVPKLKVEKATGKSKTVKMSSYIKEQTGVDINKHIQKPVGSLWHSNKYGTFIASDKMSRVDIHSLNEFSRGTMAGKKIYIQEAGKNVYLVQPRRNGVDDTSSLIQKYR